MVRVVGTRTKVKTGCGTCRIRKVKCDENKPSCNKCLSTGRTCDGYQSPFRFCVSQTPNTHVRNGKADVHSISNRPTLSNFDSDEVDLLNRCFSVKTIFDIKLDCDKEAKEVLLASLNDPSIRHAISSLKALREDFETTADSPSSVDHPIGTYDYGLQQYGMALRGLMSKLSSPGFRELKSALLCCQIFISIEQVQGNYAAMAQHIIRGLGIMREYRARPSLTVDKELVPAGFNQLPLLDVFIIKLFAAPCKFAEPTASISTSGASSPACPISPDNHSVEMRNHRAIAPNMRTELTRIAMSTLAFLEKVSRIDSRHGAVQLLAERTAHLNSLESWLIDIELVHVDVGPLGLEPISVSFMRLFHLILRVVLLGTLVSSPDLSAELQIESERLQGVADALGERLRDYNVSTETKNTLSTQSRVR